MTNVTTKYVAQTRAIVTFVMTGVRQAGSEMGIVTKSAKWSNVIETLKTARNSAQMAAILIELVTNTAMMTATTKTASTIQTTALQTALRCVYKDGKEISTATSSAITKAATSMTETVLSSAAASGAMMNG